MAGSIMATGGHGRLGRWVPPRRWCWSAGRKLACTDIRGMNGHPRFYDNGHYIGHDEPSTRFISNRPRERGSAEPANVLR
jgi:hypothetical protein